MSHRTKFTNPPINELGVGLYHLPLVELKAQHIGIYWERIRERYPFCDQQLPIASVFPIPPVGSPSVPFQNVPGEVFPLPRFWFSSSAHATLIQVQRDAFLINWRRTPENDYPHFEAVEAAFWRELGEYRDFLRETIGAHLDVVNRCELLYVNLIDVNEFFSTPAEIENILPATAGLANMHSDSRQLLGLNAAATFQVNDNLSLDYTAKLGRRPDTKALVAVLELKAHGAPHDLRITGTDAWYKAAHDAIHEFFLSSTAKKVQETVWKPL
jgi:uncharacterized protein (TIGR04255 family)